MQETVIFVIHPVTINEIADRHPMAITRKLVTLLTAIGGLFCATMISGAEIDSVRPVPTNQSTPGDIQNLLLKANAGDAFAQFTLGQNYLTGRSVTKNMVEGLKWYRKAADQGFEPAEERMGNVYLVGTGGLPADPFEALKWFRKADSQGFLPVDCLLGYYYAHGVFLPNDSTESASWYRKAAERLRTLSESGLETVERREGRLSVDSADGLRLAMTEDAIGDMYSEGNGIPKDVTEAVKWYRKAADHGYASTQIRLGGMFAKGDGVAKDDNEAVKWYRMAAEGGNEVAEVDLGDMYAKGEGVPLDPSEAAGWYHKAAIKGYSIAELDLGNMYANSSGVQYDRSEALKWYYAAAEHGEAWLQEMLGDKFVEGSITERNFIEAAKWYREAAVQGWPSAEDKLGDLYEKGDGVAKDPSEARVWHWKAAGDRGDASAQFILGAMYYYGQGVARDLATAAIWCRKAADQGNAQADCMLGWMYQQGEGLPHDNLEAVKWFRLSADRGNATAQMNLAAMYGNGSGVTKDLAEAVRWYRKAADQGNADAQFDLGVAYTNGFGVSTDYPESFKWYRASAYQGNINAEGNLGFMYASGTGVAKDEVEGLAWTYLASVSGDPQFVKNRQIFENQIGRELSIVAQRRSKELLNEIDASQNAKKSSSSGNSSTGNAAANTPKSSGSGSIVSQQGLVLTAAHVVAGANSLQIYTSLGLKGAKVIRIDEANDIAILQLDQGSYPALPVTPSRRVRLGQSVATIGFPNIDIQGFSPKVTKGEISSLNGIGDDPRSWQISVPVQPGNSGGPLLDEYGNLVGVVVSKLSIEAAKATNDLPQNVSYAVKSTYALALLDEYLNDVPEAIKPDTTLQFEDMIAKAQQSVVLILVY